MRQLEQYVRGSQLPEPKPKRPALLRSSAVPARTASGGLGAARGEAQTPFQPVAQVAGVRQERYLNGAGRVAVDPSLVSYVSYVATTGNVAVLDVSIPAAQLPQGRFFRLSADLGRAGSDATPIATGVVDPYEQDMAVWSAPDETSAILPGTFRSEYDVAITFALGVGSDKQASNNFQGVRFGQQNLSSSLLSGPDGAFSARTPSGGGFSASSAPGVHETLLSASLSAPRAAYEAALASAGAVSSGFGYALLIGVAYVSRQIWVGPAGYIRDAVTGGFVAVADGQVLNEATSDGVDESPTISASLTYRAF